jgi:SnoaL-like domain
MNDSDVTAITQLVNLYGLAVDSRRWDLFDRIFAPDVDADYGPTSHWTDRQRFKSDFAAFHDPFDSTQHTMSTHVIRVEDDRAHSFCNGGWRLVRTAAG